MDPVTPNRWRPWREAMAEALYGPAGFYRHPGAPARHFRTAAHVGAAWADAIAELARRVAARLGDEPMTVVDLGAGGGELLAGLAARLPDRFGLVGVERAPRPAGLDARIGWRADTPDGLTGLLIAVEWLDVVPVDVAEVDEAGRVRMVTVDDRGRERLAGGLGAADRAWLRRWWPLTEPGQRAEIGRPRDEAWAAATARLRRGLAVAVDYAADPGRHRYGTLTGYRNGRLVRPVPDGGCDLTAHVHFGSLSAPGDRILTQREALAALGVTGDLPSTGGDPRAYLTALERAGRDAELRDPRGLGGFTWLLRPVGCHGAARTGRQARPSRPPASARDAP